MWRSSIKMGTKSSGAEREEGGRDAGEGGSKQGGVVQSSSADSGRGIDGKGPGSDVVAGWGNDGEAGSPCPSEEEPLLSLTHRSSPSSPRSQGSPRKGLGASGNTLPDEQSGEGSRGKSRKLSLQVEVFKIMGGLRRSEEQDPETPSSDKSPQHFGRSVSIHQIAKTLVARKSSKINSQNPAESSDNANAANSEQALLVTKQGTIWHAVCKADTDEGRLSWDRATCGYPEDEGNEWMTGKPRGRGVMGETPLHLAVLFNNGTEHDRIMHALWDKYVDLRTAQYSKPLYKGENVLHIAIVRKLSFDIIRKFVESPEGPKLMNQRATGEFFKKPELSDGCCDYGELPLCFAACTNQPDIVGYLVEQGAHLDVITLHEGYSLLHLMVLHSAPRAKETDGDKIDSVEDVKWCLEMYDFIQKKMEMIPFIATQHSERSSLNVYEHMRKMRDQSGHTPLALAARWGSIHMFNHLMNKNMTLEWVFGPVTCRKLYLDGIDVPLESERKILKKAQAMTVRRKRCSAGFHPVGGNVVEVVVEAERLDILAHGTIKKILDEKWDQYARMMFTMRFWWTVVFTGVLMFSSVCDPSNSRGNVLLLAAADVFLILAYLPTFLRQTIKIYNGSHSLMNMSAARAIDSFEVVYALTTFPMCLVRGLVHVHRVLASDQPAELVWHGLPGRELWIADLDTTMMTLCSYTSFCNIFIGMMGFPEYGNFALMLIQMLAKDVRIFLVIYSIFLFGFSHIHYVSGRRPVGTEYFLASFQECFKAVLQQVNLDQKHWVDHSIALGNFFLVSVVLTNLLIAMLSNTFQDISIESKRKWQLLRASIIVKLDKGMSDEERSRSHTGGEIFWKWEQHPNGMSPDRRFMTFTTGENRSSYRDLIFGIEIVCMLQNTTAALFSVTGMSCQNSKVPRRHIRFFKREGVSWRGIPSMCSNPPVRSQAHSLKVFRGRKAAESVCDTVKGLVTAHLPPAGASVALVIVLAKVKRLARPGGIVKVKDAAGWCGTVEVVGLRVGCAGGPRGEVLRHGAILLARLLLMLLGLDYVSYVSGALLGCVWLTTVLLLQGRLFEVRHPPGLCGAGLVKVFDSLLRLTPRKSRLGGACGADDFQPALAAQALVHGQRLILAAGVILRRDAPSVWWLCAMAQGQRRLPGAGAAEAHFGSPSLPSRGRRRRHHRCTAHLRRCWSPAGARGWRPSDRGSGQSRKALETGSGRGCSTCCRKGVRPPRASPR